MPQDYKFTKAHKRKVTRYIRFSDLVAKTDDFLREMADPDHAPSGTKYIQNGVPIKSLGVFEHWDGAATMQYSRNIDPKNGKGIEFLYFPLGGK